MAGTWSAMFRDSAEFWVQFVLFPAVVAIGAIGNSITIYILVRKKLRLSSTIYRTALSISDLIFLLVSFSISWSFYDRMQSVKNYWRYIPIGLWIADASNVCRLIPAFLGMTVFDSIVTLFAIFVFSLGITGFTSVWLTVSFTVERYIAVCHPMLTKFPFSDQQAGIVATCVYILCFLAAVPASLEWEAGIRYTAQTGGTNDTAYTMAYTTIGKNPVFRLTYHGLSALLFALVPFVILVIGNFLLISAVQKSQKIRLALISSHVRRRQAHLLRQENRITVTLIMVIVLFFVCQLPKSALQIYTCLYTPEKDSPGHNVLIGVEHIFNLLMAINAVSNFILYIASSTNNRQAFFDLLCYLNAVNRFRDRSLQEVVVVFPRILPLEDRFRYADEGGEIEVNEMMLCDSCESSDCVNYPAVIINRKCATWAEVGKSSGSVGRSSLLAREAVTV